MSLKEFKEKLEARKEFTLNVGEKERAYASPRKNNVWVLEFVSVEDRTYYEFCDYFSDDELYGIAERNGWVK